MRHGGHYNTGVTGDTTTRSSQRIIGDQEPPYSPFWVTRARFGELGEVLERVRRSPVDPDFEVEVGTCADPRAADPGNHFTRRDLIT